eukprot:gene11428-11574_t
MGDITDMVAAAFAGDDRRAAKDVADLTRSNEAHISPDTHPPHTTSQDWPRDSLADQPAAADDSGHPAASDTSYEGTIPSSSPPKEPPALEQNPPEQAVAGVAGGGYAARGGDNRAI